MSTSFAESSASASASASASGQDASSNCSNGDSSGSVAVASLHFGSMFVSPKTEDGYEMSDNDPWSDDSDSDDDVAERATRPKRPQKAIPRWAWKHGVSERLAEMQASRVDPDTIFPPLHPDTCRVELIFGGHRVRARTSSRDWTRDGLQAAEVEQYQRCMKFHGRAHKQLKARAAASPPPPPKKKTRTKNAAAAKSPSPSPSPERRPVTAPSRSAAQMAPSSSSPHRAAPRIGRSAVKRRPPLAIPLFPLSRTAIRRLLLTAKQQPPEPHA
jgi:hypothetical protein